MVMILYKTFSGGLRFLLSMEFGLGDGGTPRLPRNFTCQAAARHDGRGTRSGEASLTLSRVPPALAQRGDIGVADYEGAVLVAALWFIGEHIMAKTEKGTLRLPRDRLKRAFRVE